MSDEIEGDIPSNEVRSLWNAVLSAWLGVTCLASFELTHAADGMVAWYTAFAGFVGVSLAARFGPTYRTFGLAVPCSVLTAGSAVWWSWFDQSAFTLGVFGMTVGGGIGACVAHAAWQRRANLTAGQGVRELSSIPTWALRCCPIPLVLAATMTATCLDDGLRGSDWWNVGLRWFLTLSAVATCLWCLTHFLRPFVELCLEPVARLLYRIRSKGEQQLPAFGPCLVVANHAFWFDPCVLGVVLPRPITPIMTQRFFNVWFLKPLLKYVFRVIVVPETPIKRETPELEQAVAALDRGEVVVIFPEGYLRRKEEVPLRRFGQGVWRILSARPETPVVACWVEGGWGSKFSFKDGPPTVNKPMDFRRRIDVGVSEAEAVPAEVLADQMATRLHLMNRVSAVRPVLGLPPLPAFERVNVTDGGDSTA